jgi:3',5'-nucleoside bisphosphate phosphatase
MAVDLHTHTTFSDGTLTPEQLISEAVQIKLTALAITDHDEIKACKRCLEMQEDFSVQLVTGVELSIDIRLEGTAHMHMLGLFIDVENDELNQVLNELRDARRKRAILIINKLRSSNVNIEQAELDEVIGDGSAGRPHVAQLLLNKKIVGSVWEAFNKYLSKDKPAYVPKKKIGLKNAIELIHRAGGLSILAHPVSLRHKQYKQTEATLRELKYAGLDGIEAYYSSHTPNYTKFLISAAKRNNLLLSGGSDFHGTVKPDTHLGTGKGELYVPDTVYMDLKSAVKKRKF